ncbi:uncharacterized protein FA14DRAFT_79790 [Meira miltonrushii]|uniref:Uncharacterized protein n=1 Tax=Meira miltonrushii TaxID=1280837 RepID=A0A316V7E3_9BASI|nr:uncharacterized protein FA14DRAFT_79790 [Meira miltonrushii]PWN32938.1 hypothetical protein FA14DRAFT_79790 [Meira miltonrushii]
MLVRLDLCRHPWTSIDQALSLIIMIDSLSFVTFLPQFLFLFSEIPSFVTFLPPLLFLFTEIPSYVSFSPFHYSLL